MIQKRVISNITQTAPYLVRWSIALPFGLSLKLHKILRADDDRCAHDHPWWMLRVILSGGYTEVCGEALTLPSPGRRGETTAMRVAVRKPWRPWAPWRVYWCSASFRHRITTLTRGPSWSLVLVGGKRREWGFYTVKGWMPWRRFVSETRGTRVMWCDDGSGPQSIDSESR